MLNISRDALSVVFSFCKHSDVLNVRLVCKKLRKMCNFYYVARVKWIERIWLPEYFIREYEAYVDLRWVIARKDYVSLEFIRDYSEYIFWSGLSSKNLAYWYQLEAFLEEFKDYLNWSIICETQILSEALIKKYIDMIDWDKISYYQKLSLFFIDKYKDRLNWHNISNKQKLTEEFIRINRDRVNWFFISCNQKLSESFILENKDRVNWKYIFKYQKVSDESKEKYKVIEPIYIPRRLYYCRDCNCE